MKKLLFLFFLIAAHSEFSYAKTMEITVWKKTVNDNGVIQQLLYLAMEITRKEYGDYKFIASNGMGQNRALRELASARLDIAHFVATTKRETQASPVRIPIMQGLLGYRLCLIKADNQEKFTGITNKQQWIDKNITIGQHHNWPDTTILKSNGLKVQTTYKSELLLQQLAKNRFDCFARGINEISYEQRSHQSLDLAIEKNIVIHYPLPQFFFVNPEKPLLAARLQLGLTRLQESGKTDKIFDNYYRELIEHLNLKQRVFIELQNPTLSTETINALKTSTTRFKQKYFPTKKNR
jgi:hypothetical protein